MIKLTAEQARNQVKLNSENVTQSALFIDMIDKINSLIEDAIDYCHTSTSITLDVPRYIREVIYQEVQSKGYKIHTSNNHSVQLTISW